MTRADLEAAVEHGIALLDAWDGDTDFEADCDDDEASEDEGHDSDTETPSIWAVVQ